MTSALRGRLGEREEARRERKAKEGKGSAWILRAYFAIAASNDVLRGYSPPHFVATERFVTTTDSHLISRASSLHRGAAAVSFGAEFGAVWTRGRHHTYIHTHIGRVCVQLGF